MGLKKVHKTCINENPQLLIITPLKTGDTISEDTLKTVKYNNLSFHWYSYGGDNNVMMNFCKGIAEYKREVGKSPPCVIKIDADTKWKFKTLDYMYQTLMNSKDSSIGYCYCSFEYKGTVNAKFPTIPFNSEKLKRSNYISSNSMILTDVYKRVSPVISDDYIRLLDWAYWLKLLYYGYKGIPCNNGSFVAKSKEKDVSSQGIEDYQEKYRRVYKDFVEPLEFWGN